MGLSRKREKELKRLRGNAEDLWQQQQEVLEHAREVAKEARRQLGHLTQEELAPRVKDLIDTRVRPGVEHSLASGLGLVGSARSKLVDGVLPSVATVVGSTLSMVDAARNRQLQPMVENVSRRASAFRKAVEVPEPKSGMGAGGVIGMSVGIAVLMGIGYAVWQTFRADDELWIADDEPDLPVTPAP